MGIELRYTCLNCKPSQSTRLPPGVSGTSRTSGNLASDRPDWVDTRPPAIHKLSTFPRKRAAGAEMRKSLFFSMKTIETQLCAAR